MRIEVRESSELGPEDLAGLRTLWDEAFGDTFTVHDEQHALGGVHVIGRDGADIVSHASVAPRRIRFGSSWMDVGYVEGVATAPSAQGRGHGTEVMTALHSEMDRRWVVGVLSTGRSKTFYERLGWIGWRGPSYVAAAHGETRTPDEDAGLMVRARSPEHLPDVDGSITCEDRPGDAW